MSLLMKLLVMILFKIKKTAFSVSNNQIKANVQNGLTNSIMKKAVFPAFQFKSAKLLTKKDAQLLVWITKMYEYVPIF